MHEEDVSEQSRKISVSCFRLISHSISLKKHMHNCVCTIKHRLRRTYCTFVFYASFTMPALKKTTGITPQYGTCSNMFYYATAGFPLLAAASSQQISCKLPTSSPPTASKLSVSSPQALRKLPANSPQGSRKVPASSPKAPLKLHASSPQAPRKRPASPQQAKTNSPQAPCKLSDRVPDKLFASSLQAAPCKLRAGSLQLSATFSQTPCKPIESMHGEDVQRLSRKIEGLCFCLISHSMCLRKQLRNCVCSIKRCLWRTCFKFVFYVFFIMPAL